MSTERLLADLTLPRFIQQPDSDVFLGNNYLTIDLETTNYDTGDASNINNSIVYGFISGPNIGKHQISGLSDLTKHGDLFSRCDFVVAHGAKFEIKWLIRAGIDVSKILFYDTLLGEFILAGNRNIKLDLNSASIRYGGRGKESVVSKMIKAGVCPSEIPTKLLERYCQQDVEETEKVFIKQRKILKKLDLLKVFFLRCILTPVLSDMEMKGIYLDHQMVRKVHYDSVKEYNKIINKLNEITGGINMASTDQVAQFLYQDLGFDEIKDHTGSLLRNKPSKRWLDGKPKTDEDTILALRPKNKQQRLFIEFKQKESKLRKKITGYTTRFLDACEQNGCFIYGTLNQSIAGTHRLSSTSPNLQNFDRNLKRVFTARNKGWVMHSADYKSLEFVVAGILTHDPQIIEDIKTKFDVHSYTASIIFERDWIKAGGNRKSQKGEEIRTDSKQFTFKPLFGGTSGTKAQKAYYKAFKDKYRICYEKQMEWVHQVLKTKHLRIPTGLIFYWPDTEVTESGYITNTSKIFNYPVQNFSFELASVGVTLLWHHIKALNLNSFLVNFVHDSVLSEEDPKEEEVMRNLFDYCLSKSVPGFIKRLIGFDLILPLEVEQKVTKWWDYNSEETKAA